MDLQKLLGFPLDQVRLDPDGTSTPPEVSPLAPPTKPKQKAPEQDRLFQATRIEGLAPPPPPPAPPAQAAPPTPFGPPTRIEPMAMPVRAAPAPVVVATAPALQPLPPLPPPAAAAAARPAATPRSAPASWIQALTGAGELIGKRWGLIALSSALLGFGATVLVALLVRGASKVEPPAARRAPAVAPVAAPAPVLLRERCVRQREPAQLLRGVSSTFALEARALPGGVDVLLGLATSNGTALGLRLNATTLASSELLRESGARELLGVVPQPTAPKASFAVDRANVGGYREWRTLPDRPDLALARTNRALHLIERSSQHERALWPLGADEEISRPRLEWQDAQQLALVLRRGGRQGKLVLGWLQPEHGDRSALRELPFAGSELGLPSLATQGDVALVTAAARETARAPWHIELTASTRQGRARRLELPGVTAGAERESFAPSVTALPGARWFLQWTEGQQGLRRVRGVTLDHNFALLGEPLTLSPADASAGGGNVLAVEEGLLSLFLVQRAGLYELWATTLSCR